MGVTERRMRERDALRRRIMDTAREIFAREGYEAVSMRRIADAIEYTPTAIYAHFKDKATLFREIIASDFAAFNERFFGIEQVADPAGRIWLIGHAYIKFAVEHPSHYRLMFMTPPQVIGVVSGGAPRHGDPDTDSYAYLHKLVAEAIAAGRFRPQLTDVQLVAQTLWAAVHGVAALQVTHGTDPTIAMRPLDRRVRLMLDSILLGLLARPEEIDRIIPEAIREARAAELPLPNLLTPTRPPTPNPQERHP